MGDLLAEQIVSLDDALDRTTFTSGVDPLDRYFRTQVGQDQRRRVTACFVLIDPEHRRAAGYYTLSALSMSADTLPAPFQKRLPHYGSIPCTLLGRLAVDQAYRARGVGRHLLIDALRRALNQTTQVASWAVVVDAKNESAAQFYARHGFLPLPAMPSRLFMPMRTVEESLR